MSYNVELIIDLDGDIDSGEAVISKIEHFTPNNVSQAFDSTELIRNDNLPLLGVIGGKLENGMRYASTDGKYGLRGGLVGENGKLAEEFSITVKSKGNKDINNVTIFFDKANNQFPTLFQVDGEADPSINDDSELTIKFDDIVKAKTITFLEWNRVGYNAVISGVAFTLNNMKFDFNWINNIRMSTQIMPEQSEPFMNVMPNVGSFTINDNGGEILDLANEDILLPNLKSELWLNNYLMDIRYINEWENYDHASQIVGGNVVDLLSKLEIKRYFLYSEVICYDIIIEIFEELNIDFYLDNYIVVHGLTKPQSVIMFLNSNVISYINETITYRELIVKICEFLQLILVYKNGKIYFENARPRISEEEKNTAIKILPISQASNFNEKIINKNDYKGVQYVENNYDISYFSSDSIKFTYGNGKYIAVGDRVISYSDNGADWTEKSTDKIYSDVTYGNGRYVAVGERVISYSDNGADWTEKSTNKNYRAVTYGNGRYIAVGDSVISYSDNGADWTEKSTDKNYRAVTYGNGRYIAVGDSVISYSDNGADWTIAKLTDKESVFGFNNAVTYGNGRYVAVGERVISYSDNGADWTRSKDEASIIPYISVAYTNFRVYKTNYFIAIGAEYRATSKDGINWNFTSMDGLGYDINIINGNIVQMIFDGGQIYLKFYNDTYLANQSNFFNITAGSTKLYGDNKNVYNYPQNSLIQYKYTPDFMDIIEDYSKHNGIREASIELNSSVDYYNMKGKKVISWEEDYFEDGTRMPPVVQIGDVVVVYSDKKDKQGNYIPYSRYKDGSTRYYKVIGTELNIGGACTNLLKLREVW